MSNFLELFKLIIARELELKKQSNQPKRKVIGKLIDGKIVEYEVTEEGVKTNENS